MKKRTKKWLWIGITALLLVLAAGAWWRWRFQSYTPMEAALDIRAAVAARNAAQPVEQFLELRYGPLTNPVNRRKAFLDFFNVGHIEGLQMIVKRMPAQRRPGSIDGMAAWVAQYRQTMSPKEKAALRNYLTSQAGQDLLRQATAKYLSQDVYYRAATAPVIEELMATLAEIKQP